MKRKEFLSIGLMGGLGLASALVLERCGGSTTPSDPTSRTFTSSSNSGHTHTITLQRSEVTNPPGAGISRATSSNSGHTHAFTMTQAELQTVNGGGSATVTVSVADLHDHTFTITKWF